MSWAIAIGCGAAIVAILVWPRKPAPVVGNVLPFHDPKRRTPFRSNRST